MASGEHVFGTVTCMCLCLTCCEAIAQHQHATDGNGHSVLAKMSEAIRSGDTTLARQLADTYERQYARDSTADHAMMFEELKYQLLSIDVSLARGAVDPGLVAALTEQYEAADAGLRGHLAEIGTDDAAYLVRQYARLQRIRSDYATTAARLGMHEAALVAVENKRETYLTFRNVLERPMKTVVVNSVTGEREIREVPLYAIHHLDHPEAMQLNIVRVARELHSSAGDDKAREVLIGAYRAYADGYPARPKAGLYLNLAMELEGSIDLDELMATYDKCEDKSGRQYNGGILGISNLLIDAGRTKDALRFLEQVQEDAIPNSRLAELYYGLGRCYLKEGDHARALTYLLRVKALTDRYEGVDQKTVLALGLEESEGTGLVGQGSVKPTTSGTLATRTIVGVLDPTVPEGTATSAQSREDGSKGLFPWILAASAFSAGLIAFWAVSRIAGRREASG